jgi:hypothetical protein
MQVLDSWKVEREKNVKCLMLNESWLYEFEALVSIFTRHGSYIPMSLNRHLCILSLILLVSKSKIYIYILLGNPLIYLRAIQLYTPKDENPR